MYINSDDIGKVFSKRRADAHKGTYGEVLCVCGSYNENGISMCGAAYLCGLAAYKRGAGIVRIYTHKENYGPVATNLPEAVYELYSDDIDRERLSQLVAKADCVVLGCGIGTDDRAVKIVRTVLESAKKRIVIDADALNIMAKKPQMWSYVNCECVITPHIGEMARLCGRSVGEIAENTVEIAKSFAREKGVTCVLKSYKTVISDGEKVYINTTGNPAMAKGGSGDLLAGTIGGALAQKHIRDGFDVAYVCACCVYLHGRAGDEAANNLGEYCVLARDIAKYL